MTSSPPPLAQFACIFINHFIIEEGGASGIDRGGDSSDGSESRATQLPRAFCRGGRRPATSGAYRGRCEGRHGIDTMGLIKTKSIY